VSEQQQPKRGRSSVAIPPGFFKCTDLGNAERLVARFRGEIRYCPQRKLWLFWDGRRWAWDQTGEVVRRAKQTVRGIYEEAATCKDGEIRKAIAKHASDSEKARAITAMIGLAQTEKDVPVLLAELDADPWKLNALNGTIDLRSGELAPHDRSELITRLAPVEYSPDAKSELWTRFLTDATGGDAELERYLQRAVGYALQGTASERAFFFLIGPPGTAKSTFIDAISAALGDYHSAASFETWLQQSNVGGNRGDLVRLASARLVTSVEVRKNAKFDEAIIKAVTGGDEITAAAKYEAEVTFKPAFALWLAANDAPAIRDDDEGAWARVRRIPFAHVIPVEEQDRALKHKLREPEVRAAVLAWAVQGCLDWQRDGLGSATAIDQSTAAYRRDMDRIAGFFDDCCEFSPHVTISRDQLRIAYEQWCKTEGIRFPLPSKEMATRLRDRDCQDGKSHGRRVWRGVQLRDAWDEEAHLDGGQRGSHGVTISQNSSHTRGQEKVSEKRDPSCPPLPPQPTLFDDPEERAAIQSES
jgi:putative DNA primase/helicase